MKYLVLGSSGQIGFSLANYIKKLGLNVLTFDIVENSSEDLRIANNPILIDKMERADFVFFLAFDVGGSRYLKTYQNTFEFTSNNVRLMENTFECLNKTKKPFLFASSQMSNMGYSPYGQLKALGELYTNLLNGLIVKFWNVYGIENDLEKSHVITDFLLKAKKNRKIDMLTDGNEQRQFLHADDCSECLIKLSKDYNNIPRNKELHITNFKWHSVMDVAKLISSIYPGTEINPAQMKDEVQKNKRNEPDPYILKYWEPKIELLEGIKLVNNSIR